MAIDPSTTTRAALASAADQMASCAHDVWLVGRSLQALASLTTSGDPRGTTLGAVGSEDLGALFELLGRRTQEAADRLGGEVHMQLVAAQHERPA